MPLSAKVFLVKLVTLIIFVNPDSGNYGFIYESMLAPKMISSFQEGKLGNY